jgi:hypothetical protein
MATPIDPRIPRIDTSDANEIFEIQPVILGGSPTDFANKVAVTRARHIELVRFWNDIIRWRRKV